MDELRVEWGALSGSIGRLGACLAESIDIKVRGPSKSPQFHTQTHTHLDVHRHVLQGLRARGARALLQRREAAGLHRLVRALIRREVEHRLSWAWGWVGCMLRSGRGVVVLVGRLVSAATRRSIVRYQSTHIRTLALLSASL